MRDEQQQIINTLIKHANSNYTFKIGVRDYGRRIRYTLNATESLTSPADYTTININRYFDEEESFSDFAEKICNHRIKKILLDTGQNYPDITIRNLLPFLPHNKEAELLGVESKINNLKEAIKLSEDISLISDTQTLEDLDLYIIESLAKGEGVDTLSYLKNILRSSAQLKYKLNEYRYASLFTIKRTSGIKKYYTGWETFSKLSANNIRYLLELVERALNLHLRSDRKLSESISPENQTKATEIIGRKNFEELKGLSSHGEKLTKFVLSLGRIFNRFAVDWEGHSHEVNQFRIKLASKKETIDDSNTSAANLIKAAIMHLAIIPFPSNKPKEQSDTRENTYQLNPIFASYFIFSYRKRRNLMLKESEIIGLIENSKTTIDSILDKNNRDVLDKSINELPLFSNHNMLND